MAYSESVGTGLFEVYLAKIVAKKEFNELFILGMDNFQKVHAP